MITSTRSIPVFRNNATPPLRGAARTLLAVAILAAGVLVARGGDGTWSNTGGGLWSTTAPGNWLSNNIADGAGFTANFNTLNIPASTVTVNLDSARTIGSLIFGDTDTFSAGSWALANNGIAANILTLAGATPTVTVNAMSSVNNIGSNVTISAVIDGTGGLTKNGTGTNTTGTNNTSGTGTLTLSGANTYTGATNIDTGTIRVTNASAFGGIAGGKLATNVVNVATGARLLLAGVNIANTVNLNGATALSVASGNSVLSGSVNLQSNSAAYVNNGGNYTLTFSGTLALGSNVLSLNTSGSANGALITNTLTGGSTSGVTKNGSGPLTMSGNGSGYSGTTTLTGGDLLVGSVNALGTGTFAMSPGNNSVVVIRSTDITDWTIATAVTIGSGIAARYAFGTSSTGKLTFTNTTGIGLDAVKLFEVANRTQFDAGFTGGGGITMQTGTGTLLLSGASTYSGATTVNAGTLLANNTTGSATGTGAVSVGISGTLGGTGRLAPTGTNGLTVSGNGANGGLVDLSTNSLTEDLILDLAGTGTATFQSGAKFKFELGVPTTSDVFAFTGMTDASVATFNNNVVDFSNLGGLAQGVYTLFTFDGANQLDNYTGTLVVGTGLGAFSGEFIYNATNIQLSVIPEPGTWTTLLGGLGMLLGFQRCRRRA